MQSWPKNFGIKFPFFPWDDALCALIPGITAMRSTHDKGQSKQNFQKTKALRYHSRSCLTYAILVKRDFKIPMFPYV